MAVFLLLVAGSSMSRPNAWLSARAPGYGNLSGKERKAILHFALLWSLFEARVLASNGNVPKILKKCREWEEAGRLCPAKFAVCLNYFRSRYYQNAAPTQFYEGLRLRLSDPEPLVLAVLSGQNRQPRDELSVLLIIIYRLRNNLFHGEKWSYQIEGQLHNFKYANDVLIEALGCYGGL